MCQEYGRTIGQTVLTCEVQADAYSVGAVGFVLELDDVPYTDASATRSSSGEITVFAVNRSVDATIPVSLSVLGMVPGDASASTLAGPSHDSVNDSPNQPFVEPKELPIAIGDPIVASLPPCSLTVIRLRP